MALVVSNMVAWGAVQAGLRWRGESHPAVLPPLPSLPPLPGLQAREPERRLVPRGAEPGMSSPAASVRRRTMPAGPLLGDYAIRILLIGVAAWWGARWLSAPMRGLVGASRSLGIALGRGEAMPRLDEARGTLEVRETARVFNEMADRLHEQFRARELLIAALSHDLRTPLTRMRLRMEGLAGEPAAERCIDDIREMGQLIEASLEVFRGAGVPEPARSTDIAALVQSLVDDLAEQGQPVGFAGNSAAVASVPPAALRRVVSNLVGNALRYGERAQVGVVSRAGWVTISVDDRGPGIPPDRLEAVFQPFYRLEGSRNRDTGGMGLGLYIARDLTTRCGGTLSLSNRLEGGLRAEVVLPADV
ncbi:ATP-binding protein [Aquabacterium sp. A7-Y]|uniref:ATP-binding protein n=1 Tax=Aquabacterium sp. A7-Y TaxID=1349605 RepID=UPI00223E56A6|nr:ATP-binding protein [Aquabacterium sp. A7-Y]MCW7540090.1 ATP-binding protein [Aquabacterium sp. A7-Y]